MNSIDQKNSSAARFAFTRSLSVHIVRRLGSANKSQPPAEPAMSPGTSLLLKKPANAPTKADTATKCQIVIGDS